MCGLRLTGTLSSSSLVRYSTKASFNLKGINAIASLSNLLQCEGSFLGLHAQRICTIHLHWQVLSRKCNSWDGKVVSAGANQDVEVFQ